MLFLMQYIFETELDSLKHLFRLRALCKSEYINISSLANNTIWIQILPLPQYIIHSKLRAKCVAVNNTRAFIYIPIFSCPLLDSPASSHRSKVRVPNRCCLWQRLYENRRISLRYSLYAWPGRCTWVPSATGSPPIWLFSIFLTRFCSTAKAAAQWRSFPQARRLSVKNLPGRRRRDSDESTWWSKSRTPRRIASYHAGPNSSSASRRKPQTKSLDTRRPRDPAANFARALSRSGSDPGPNRVKRPRADLGTWPSRGSRTERTWGPAKTRPPRTRLNDYT